MRCRATVLFSLGVFAFVSLMAARPARAEVCSQAVTLRVNDPGLAFIAAQAKPLVPTRHTLPAASKTVVDWPLTADDAVVHIPSLTFDIDLQKLELGMRDGSLRLFAQADITTGGAFTVDNPYAGFGTAHCNAKVELRRLSVDVGLKVSSSAGGIALTVTKAKVDLNNPASVIALEGCVLGEALTAVLTFVRTHFMGTIQKIVEKLAKEKLPPLVAAKLGDALELSKSLEGFTFQGRLDALDTDHLGVVAKLGVGVERDGPAAPCVTRPMAVPSCVGPTPELGEGAGEMFAVGVNAAVLNRGLHRVHESGLLCIDSESLQISGLQQKLDGLGPVLGLPTSTRLGFALRFDSAPQVRISRQHGLQLLVKGARAELRLQHAGGDVERVGLSFELSAAATPWIDPRSNSVALELHHLALGAVALDGQRAAPLALDPARLSRFVATVLVPTLQARLKQTQLSPSLIGVAGYVAELASVDLEEGYLVARLNAYAPAPSGDRQAPDTMLRRGPQGAVVGPQVLALQVEGNDNQTPTALLRYQWRINGGPWSEASYGGRIEVVIDTSVARVEVAAVDEDGNVDASPLTLNLAVDALPPTLQITSRPASLINDSAVTVGFYVGDERSPIGALAVTAELLRIPDGGGLAQVVGAKVVPAGGKEVRFDGLSSGVYKVRVKVADEVGNVTSTDVGFVVEQGGCAAAPVSPTTLPAAALGLLMLAILRRRRQRDDDDHNDPSDR